MTSTLQPNTKATPRYVMVLPAKDLCSGGFACVARPVLAVGGEGRARFDS